MFIEIYIIRLISTYPSSGDSGEAGLMSSSEDSEEEEPQISLWILTGDNVEDDGRISSVSDSSSD